MTEKTNHPVCKVRNVMGSANSELPVEQMILFSRSHSMQNIFTKSYVINGLTHVDLRKFMNVFTRTARERMFYSVLCV